MEQKKISREVIQKAKKASSVEEVMEIAREAEVEITKEEAEVFCKSKETPASGEKLSDDELDNVSGGGCGKDDQPCVCKDFESASGLPYEPGCGTCDNNVQFISDRGHVYWDCVYESDDRRYYDYSKMDDEDYDKLIGMK